MVGVVCGYNSRAVGSQDFSCMNLNRFYRRFVQMKLPATGFVMHEFESFFKGLYLGIVKYFLARYRMG